VSPIAVLSGVAHAQSGESDRVSLGTTAADQFRRDKNISVRERPHPEYEAAGLRVGAFMVYPRLETTVEGNDNIFATKNNKVSDTVLRFVPSVSINSNWNRHSLSAFGRATVSRNADTKSEDTEQYDVGVNGRLDVQRFLNVTGGLEYQRLAEPRTSQNAPDQSDDPIKYNIGKARAGVEKSFNRVKLAARGEFARYDYRNGLTTPTVFNPSGVVRQDDRDRDVSALTLRSDYAISPDTAVFVQGTLNKRDYNDPSTVVTASRDSDGYELLAGANFEVTRLIRGDAGVGYLSQNYDDPRFDDIKGFGARVNLEWFPDELTTVTGTLERVVEDSVQFGAGGFLSSAATVQVDHELLRNVILSGTFAYADDQFKGVDRTDKRWLAGVNGTYLMNRYVGLSLGYTYLDQSSSGANRGREFTVQKVALSLVLQR
jgi:hypothetical protein